MNQLLNSKIQYFDDTIRRQRKVEGGQVEMLEVAKEQGLVHFLLPFNLDL